MRALNSTDELSIPRSSNNTYTPIPDWKKVFDGHSNVACNAYLAWCSEKRPRSSPIHEWIKNTKVRFRFAPKIAKRNKINHADKLAADFDTGGVEGFPKWIKDYNSGPVAYSNTMRKDSDSNEIPSMWL